jgi:hypothetical protein
MSALLKSLNDSTENHQIVNYNAEVDFGLLSAPGLCTERGMEPAFVSAERALDLPALAVNPFEEALSHLAPEFCFWPPPCLSSALDRNNAVRFEFAADEFMKSFRVAAAIPQDTPKLDAPMCFAQHSRSLQCVTRGSQIDVCADEQMGIDVNAGCKLGPTWRMKAAFASMGTVIKRGQPNLESGAVAGNLRPLGNQAVLTRNDDSGLEQAFEIQFFKRRCSALHKAEYVGTIFRPRTERRSDHS